MHTILCHYHEIALKGRNRAFFEEQLCRNVRTALRGLPIRGVRRLFGRIVVGLTPESPVEEIQRRLGQVFGIVTYSPAWVCRPNVAEIQESILQLIGKQSFSTFKVHARRTDKSFPLESPEINRRIGAFLREKTHASVNLEGPDLTCYIQLVTGAAYLYFDRCRGAGGLPVGTGGKVVVLLSGGIDSPVAAYKIMRRGCQAIFVHFHSYPHTSLESQDKVRELVRLLTRYQYRSKLYMVPFAEAQRQVVALTPPETRVILYRRLMVRLAEMVAWRERARALVTGDSIGQVASQTLENIQVITQVATIPILRPLIGDDKEDIIRTSQEIGTFATSILPDVDCCSLFVPRHPETRARLTQILRAEEPLDLKSLAQNIRKSTVVEILSFPPIKSANNGRTRTDSADRVSKVTDNSRRRKSAPRDDDS